MLVDRLHLSATEDFISENAVWVQPVRFERISDGTGGWRQGEPEGVAPVVVRKVGLNSVTGVQEATTPDGSTVRITANVIAMPDADIKKGDTLPFEDGKYVVLSVSFDPPWRLRAEVYKVG